MKKKLIVALFTVCVSFFICLVALSESPTSDADNFDSSVLNKADYYEYDSTTGKWACGVSAIFNNTCSFQVYLWGEDTSDKIKITICSTYYAAIKDERPTKMNLLIDEKTSVSISFLEEGMNPNQAYAYIGKNGKKLFESLIDCSKLDVQLELSNGVRENLGTLEGSGLIGFKKDVGSLCKTILDYNLFDYSTMPDDSKYVLINDTAISEPKKNTLWICPACGTENSANFCGNCGEEKPVTKETIEANWTCPVCGTENTTNFCGNCGKKKPDIDINQEPTSELTDTPTPEPKIEVTINNQARSGIYFGDLVDGVPQGQGTFDSEDDLPELHYEGNWDKGATSGKGTMIDKGYTIHFDNDQGAYDRTGPYEGNVVDGIPNGKGKFTTKNSEGISWTYTGEFSDGTFNGLGEMVWESDSFPDIGLFTNGEYTPSWAQQLNSLAIGEGYTIFESSMDFLTINENIFTSSSEILPEMITKSWDVSSFKSDVSAYCNCLLFKKELTVDQYYKMEGYSYPCSFAIMEDQHGTLFYGYFANSPELSEGSTVGDLYLLPLNWITYKNTNNKDLDAVFCAYVALGSQEIKPKPEPTQEPTVEAELVHFDVGQIIKFGSYEQDNNIENGKEPIQWRVLATEGNRTLVISQIALDAAAFAKYGTSIAEPDLSWENCSLREWLNHDFFNEAFSEEEKTQILVSNLETEDKAGYHRTEDRLFVLSIDEANQYFSSNQDMACRGSDYAISKLQDDLIENGGYVYWWLRDMVSIYHDDKINFLSSTFNEAASVSKTDGIMDGENTDVGLVAGEKVNLVRPAMWVEFKETANVTAHESVSEPKTAEAAEQQAELPMTEPSEESTPEPTPEPESAVLSLDVTETELAAGSSIKLTPKLANETATKVKYKWDTSNKKVASVSNGTVRAAGEGTATITCSTTIDGETFEASCTINVYVGIKSITVKKKSITLDVNSTEKIDVKIIPQNATNQTLTWTSDKPDVAIVDSTGRVMAVYGGECTITGTANDGSGKTVSVSVFVPTLSCSTKTVNLTLGRISTFKVKLFTKNKSAIKVDDGNARNNFYGYTTNDDSLDFKIIPMNSGQATLTITDPNSPKSTIKIKIVTPASEGLDKGYHWIKNDNEYREWLRGSFSGRFIRVKGYVRQIEYDGDDIWMLIATKSKYDNYVFASFKKPKGSKLTRILEGDEIGIFGKSNGNFQYTTVMNTSNTVPRIDPWIIEPKIGQGIYFINEYYHVSDD